MCSLNSCALYNTAELDFIIFCMIRSDSHENVATNLEKIRFLKVEDQCVKGFEAPWMEPELVRIYRMCFLGQSVSQSVSQSVRAVCWLLFVFFRVFIHVPFLLPKLFYFLNLNSLTCLLEKYALVQGLIMEEGDLDMVHTLLEIGRTQLALNVS